jgi:hypothetical protein
LRSPGAVWSRRIGVFMSLKPQSIFAIAARWMGLGYCVAVGAARMARNVGASV